MQRNGEKADDKRNENQAAFSAAGAAAVLRDLLLDVDW